MPWPLNMEIWQLVLLTLCVAAGLAAVMIYCESKGWTQLQANGLANLIMFILGSIWVGVHHRAFAGVVTFICLVGFVMLLNIREIIKVLRH